MPNFSVLHRWNLSLLLALCLGLLACQHWQDPTLDLPDFSQAQLTRLAKTDSLLITLDGKALRTRLDSLLRWTEVLRNFDETAALDYAQAAAKLATEANRDRYQGMARYYLASLESRQQLFAEGMADPLVNARIAHRLLAEETSTRWPILTSSLLGDIFFRQAQPDIDSSRWYLTNAWELALSKQGDEVVAPLYGEVLHGFGNLAAFQRDFEQADSLYRLAEQNYLETDNEPALRRLRLNWANLAISAADWEPAINWLQRNLVSAEQAGDITTLVKTHQDLGRLYLRRYRAAGDTLDLALSRRELRQALLHQTSNFYRTYDLLGWSYQSQASREYTRLELVDSALVNYDRALQHARVEGALEYFEVLAQSISALCDWLGAETSRSCADIFGASVSDYLHTQYSGVVDTITAELASANAEVLDFELQQQEAVSQRRIRNTGLLGGFALVVAALVFVVLYQRQKQRRLEARLAALRAQINPHFFSNSLNAIESLVNLDQREAASKYLVHFSRLTRRVLNSSLSPNTSLAGELDTARHFLKLEQLRFKDKLQYEIEVAPEVEAERVEVPSLILQPYLENAIWHGIKPKAEPGLLRLRIEREGKELVCTIEDDGIGRARARAQQAESVLGHKSVGMDITHERLVRSGGGRVQVIDLHNERGEAAGTRVVVRLPYKYQRT